MRVALLGESAGDEAGIAILVEGVLGSQRPLQQQRASEEAGRIVAQGLLARLEVDFPNTFGALAADLRNW
jgi:hypothetical protein